MLPKINPTQTKAWKGLNEYFAEKNFDLEKHIEKNSFLRECYKRNLWAYIADYVRIHYLYEHGGIYLDTDMEIVKDFSPLFENENVEYYKVYDVIKKSRALAGSIVLYSRR